MAYEALIYEAADGVLTLTLNRPEKLNAFTGAMAHELMDAFDRADADDAIRAIIVTGAGRAFCAGADLSLGAATFDHAAQSGATPNIDDPAIRDMGGRVTLRIFKCLKPVIAAVNGPAVGIGATMQLAMDMRLASEAARFGFVFARRGIVRSVHAPDDLLPAARALAREIADNTAPVSVALTRQMLWRLSAAQDPMQAHRIDSRAIFTRGMGADAAEGVTSFLEKRPAAYPQRVSTDMPGFFPWWDETPYQ
jgi:enoyl-CoA hydratase/carnithine racemase